MITIFYKSLDYKLTPKEADRSLQDIFSKWEKGEKDGEVMLVKAKTKDNILYRYISSLKEGRFFIELIKVEDKLEVKIKESLIGFILPFIFILITLLIVVFKDLNSSLPLFLISIVSIGLDYISFLSVQKETKKRVEEILSIRE